MANPASVRLMLLVSDELVEALNIPAYGCVRTVFRAEFNLPDETTHPNNPSLSFSLDQHYLFHSLHSTVL